MTELLECTGTTVKFTDSFDKLAYDIGNLGNEILWIFDSNTARMVRPLPEPNVILEPGENSKSLTSIERIINTAIENNYSSSCTFLGMGGGNICDITGLAASLYKSGCKLVFVPTTVTAMSNACIGGNNGISFKSVKNAIGTRYKASEVFICVDYLKSLSTFEFNNGLSEIIKNAYLTNSEDLLKTLVSKKNKILDRDSATVRLMIEQCLTAKTEIIETGNSALFDLGMPLAYAFESISSLKCSHGQAIAWGVCKTLQLSVSEIKTNEKLCDSIIKLYKSFGYNTDYRINRVDWNQFRKNLIHETNSTHLGYELLLLKERGQAQKITVSENEIMNLVIKEVGF